MFSSFFFLIVLLLPGCKADNKEDWTGWLAASVFINDYLCRENLNIAQASRVFSTGFETEADFAGFYITPQNYQGAASHELQSAVLFSQSFTHKGQVFREPTECIGNCNHRAYPTIQLYKTPAGGFRTPVMVEFQVNLEMTIGNGQWFSFATFSADRSDNWDRVVLVNLGKINNSIPDYLHLMHVPWQGESSWTYQTSDSNTPVQWTPGWHKISVCLDFHPDTGFAKVWQDDILVSTAEVRGGCGLLEQAHFGLYAPPDVTSATVYNDDLTISEIAACPD